MQPARAFFIRVDSLVADQPERARSNPERDGQHEQQDHPQDHGAPDEAHGRLQRARRAVVADRVRTALARLRDGVDARLLRERTRQTRAQRAAAGGEQHALVGVRPLVRVIAPGVDGVLEIADDREAQRREPRRYPVDHEEHVLREVRERFRAVVGRTRPFAREVFGEAIQHRARRTDRHEEPEEHAEHVTMRGHHRVDQRVAHDLAHGHVHGVDAGPLGEDFTRARHVVVIQREVDIGEIVAELAETEREVHHHHVPEERQHEADVIEHVVDERRDEGPRQHDHEPGEHAVLLLARVEAVGGPFRIEAHERHDRIVGRQRPHLFDDESQQYGKEGHATRRAIRVLERCCKDITGPDVPEPLATKTQQQHVIGTNAGVLEGPPSAPCTASGEQETIEVAQHARRRAPDEMRAAHATYIAGLHALLRIRHREETALAAFPAPDAHFVVRGVHQIAERHLEDARHFERVGRERERLVHEAHHGRDAKTRAREVVRQRPQHLDARRIEIDLFVRLAQRGGDRRGVGRLAAAAGEADLTCVIAEIVGALREQHRKTRGPHRDRHQHGGLARIADLQHARLLRLGLPRQALLETRAQAIGREPFGGDVRQIGARRFDRQAFGFKYWTDQRLTRGSGTGEYFAAKKKKAPRGVLLSYSFYACSAGAAARSFDTSFSLIRAFLPDRLRR
ncbi:hypothetical protein PT2222_40185 [Paraburkholderia tropica]